MCVYFKFMESTVHRTYVTDLYEQEGGKNKFVIEIRDSEIVEISVLLTYTTEGSGGQGRVILSIWAEEQGRSSSALWPA